MEWIDSYALSDLSRDDPGYGAEVPGTLDFASYRHRIRDLTPQASLVPSGAAPAKIAALPQKVVINCTGYGARALWEDASIVPVRGHIGWLIPQPELRYALLYKDVFVLPRRDGIVVQALEGGDMKGYGNDREVVDRGESERAVATVEELFSGRDLVVDAAARG